MRLKRSRNTQPAAAEERPAAGPGPGAGGPEAAEPAGPARTERRRRGYGVRRAGSATVGALGAGVVTLARLVMTLAVLIAVLIGLAIILRDVDANASNSIVKG